MPAACTGLPVTGTLQLGGLLQLGCSCNRGAPANSGTSVSRGSHAWQSPLYHTQGCHGAAMRPRQCRWGVGDRAGADPPPAVSATRRWPLHHPSWGHDHHRNRCTSKGGKQQNPTGKEGRRVAGAVPVQLGQGSVPTCPHVSPQCQHGATDIHKALSTGTWDPSIGGLCVCQHSPRCVCFLPSVVQIFRFLKSAGSFAEREGDCWSTLGALKTLRLPHYVGAEHLIPKLGELWALAEWHSFWEGGVESPCVPMRCMAIAAAGCCHSASLPSPCPLHAP